MFVKISDFTAEWKKEMNLTQQLMDTLTDESLQQAIAPEYRTLGQIAWHLVLTIGSMSMMGLDLEKPDGGERAPASANKIASEYRRLSQALLDAVETQWTDADLLQSKSVNGEEWSNGYSLHLIIQHEVHHRGQMTVLMRQAGLRPAGIYGPTREDWIEKGQQPYL
ncbi:DinB family protein [Brevibacillus sp. B_LB10_24]|uniref:DinB family protein n=1 Tax=Brevibacillus sp. B_LB10_24 TaxID=3380645 RepID=UPI0038B8DCFB